MKWQKNIKINDKKFLRLTHIQKNTFNKLLIILKETKFVVILWYFIFNFIQKKFDF